MRVTHYAGNYFALVQEVIAIVYEILEVDDDNRSIRGGESLLDAFGLTEPRLLEYLAGQDNYVFGTEEPPDHLFWRVAYDLFQKDLGSSPTVTHALLKQLQTILAQVADGSYPPLEGASSLREGLPSIMEHLIDSLVLTSIGMSLSTLTMFMQVLRGIADAMDLISDSRMPNVNYLEWAEQDNDEDTDATSGLSPSEATLAVSWEEAGLPPIRLRINLDNGWFILIEGNYEIELPETAEELFQWNRGPRDWLWEVRVPQVSLVDMSSLQLWQEIERQGEENRFVRFGLGTVKDVSVSGMRFSFEMPPGLGSEQGRFGSAHLFRDAFYTRERGLNKIRVRQGARGHEREVAMTLLSAAGLNPAEVVTLRWPDVDFDQGLVRDKEMPSAAIQALGDLRKSPPSETSFVFEAKGQVLNLGDLGRGVKTVMSFATDPMMDEHEYASLGCDYQSESPLPRSYGTSADPGWVGISTNCHIANALYQRMRNRGVFDASGSGVFDDLSLSYEVTTTRVHSDFSGNLFPERHDADRDEDVPNRAAGLVLADTTLRIISDDGQGEAEYLGRVLLPLAPVAYEPADFSELFVQTLEQEKKAAWTRRPRAWPTSRVTAISSTHISSSCAWT
jgi:hypothetical protein